MNKLIINHLKRMNTSILENYAIVGLSSALMENGVVRLFHQKTEPMSFIAPHNHRYSLACLVLTGKVVNTIWTSTLDRGFPEYSVKQFDYLGEPGSYGITIEGEERFGYKHENYTTGDWYYMDSHEIHTIKFSRGTKVLVFQGPDVASHNLVLDPIVNDEIVSLSDTQPWMFQEYRPL